MAMSSVVVVRRHQKSRQSEGDKGESEADSFVQLLPHVDEREVDTVMGTLLLGYSYARTIDVFLFTEIFCSELGICDVS